MKYISIAISLLLLFSGLLMTNIQQSHAEMLAPHLHRRILDNGLTLLVKEIPGSKAATVQIWVKTGSVYEEPAEAGITHLIEHMIFKGTPTRGPGELAAAIEEMGGRVNAYTSFEYTVYHATLSSRYWQKALEVLTDAVRHSVFDPAELEREKKVVLEEIGMRNDRPNIMLYQQLLSTAYRTHPYRLPVIGSEESVSSFNRDDILAYIARQYQPENMAVVVVGEVNVEAVYQATKAQLGDMAGGSFAAPELPREAPQEEPRFFHLEEDVNQSHLAIAFPICSFNNPDAAVLDVIAGILGSGDSSRLYHQLRDQKGLVYRIDASSFTPRDPGLMEVFASLDPKKLEDAMTAVLEEFFKLKYLPVEDEELSRVKRNLESDFVFNLERVEGQARVIGSFDFLTGDPREDDYLDRIRSVSKEDVMRVAKAYFSDRDVTAGVLLPRATELPAGLAELPAIIERAETAARAAVPASLLSDAYLSNTHRFRLANGITLLVREDPSVPTVGIRAAFPGGLRGETAATNGAFAFISELLPKGTASMNAREIALKIADMAGEISGFNGKNTFGLKADFLGRFFDPGLGLVRDIIRTPAFDAAEADKIRPELLDQLKQQEDSLAAVAFREFNRLLFAGHPYSLNVAGSKTAIEHFSSADLRAIYEEHARPDRLVLAVSGDVKAKEVLQKVEELFGDWQPPAAAAARVSEEEMPPVVPSSPKIFRLERDRAQVHIILGFLGTTLTDEDRFGLEVLDTILNGQSGRLFTDLRDKQSLAYSLSSFSLVGIDTGSFGFYIATSPEKREDAIKALWQQIYRIREEPVSEAELQRAKSILIGNYELSLQTHSNQALDMALNEIYGLGQDFGNRYAEHLNEVDADTVLRVARKYLLMDNYILVTVGAEGPPPASEQKTDTNGEAKSLSLESQTSPQEIEDP